MTKLLTVIAVGSLVLTACVGTPENDPDDFILTDSSQKRIDTLLNEGNNLRAIPLILAREKAGHQDSLLYERALNGLKAEWQAARDDGDWRRSIAYLRSFAVLGEEALGEGVTETELVIQGVMSYIESDQIGAAAALIQGNLTPQDFSDETRAYLAKIFSDADYHSLTAMLNFEPAPESPGMGPLTDGTVTVWVNRGFRLVGSVGVPDRGIGSGFFIDPEGYLLTNYHVIESEVDPAYKGYSRLFIKIDDESGERIPAKVIGWDKNFDLALLKTEIPVPYVFSFAEQDMPKLGDRISAIGSPGGLTKTLTSGTVSAYARSIQPMADSLQIDVPINPGNSGGPLLNSRGEVIAVVFAGISDYEGINFAIPGHYALRLIPALYDGGRVALPWLGVSAWDRGGEINLTYVTPHSPAADAGLLPGDTITRINGFPLKTIRDAQDYLTTRSPATLVSLEWERDGEALQGIVALGVRPEIPLKDALSRDAREHLLTPLFGFTVERISGRGITQKYRVLSVLQGSIADEVGFSTGDMISLRRWKYIQEADAVVIQLILKGRKAGFLQSTVQIASLLNVTTVF